MKFIYADERQRRVEFKCPGCGKKHCIPVVGNDPWEFNFDMAKPTLNPSILVTGTEDITDDEHKRIMAGEKVEPRPMVCHSYVTDGRIKFLNDCTHALAGQTVDLPEYE